MSERQYSEKEEKDVEKREEKEEKEEKSWEEKWHRDPLGTATWAVILIWAGLVLLADNMGLLTRFEILDACRTPPPVSPPVPSPPPRGNSGSG